MCQAFESLVTNFDLYALSLMCNRLLYEDFLYLVALTADIETVFGIVHADALEVEVFYGGVGVKLCLDVGDAGLL